MGKVVVFLVAEESVGSETALKNEGGRFLVVFVVAERNQTKKNGRKTPLKSVPFAMPSLAALDLPQEVGRSLKLAPTPSLALLDLPYVGRLVASLRSPRQPSLAALDLPRREVGRSLKLRCAACVPRSNTLPRFARPSLQ